MYDTGPSPSTLADGLHPGSVCYVSLSAEGRTQILGQLERARGSLDSELEEGRLVISRYCATAREQCEYWETNFISALSGGAESLRLVGDMTSCLDGGMSLDEMVEYEAAYDRMIARRFPVVTLCLYDVRRFESLEVVRALKAHTDAFLPGGAPARLEQQASLDQVEVARSAGLTVAPPLAPFNQAEPSVVGHPLTICPKSNRR